MLLPMHQVSQKTINLVWDLENQRLFSKSRLLYHLDRMIQQMQWYFSCQWPIGMPFGALGRPLYMNHRRYLWDFRARLYHHLFSL